MTFNEGNLKAGLYAAQLRISRYDEALKTYRKKVNVDGIDPKLAIEQTLEYAVRGLLRNKSNKLHAARKAAGLIPQHREETDKLTPTSQSKTRAVVIEQSSDSENKPLIRQLVLWLLIGVGVSFVFNVVAQVIYDLARGVETRDWLLWFVFLTTIPLFVLIGYLKATRPVDQHEEDTPPDEPDSIRVLGLKPTA